MPAAEVPPSLTPIKKQVTPRQTMQTALDMVALKRSAEAIELLSEEDEAGERWRKIEVELATGSSIREALNVVYGENWFTSSFPREVHAQLVAHDSRYLSRIQKLVQSSVRSVWPSGRESVGEQIFLASLLNLLPKALRPTVGSPGGYRILHKIESGDSSSINIGGNRSMMKSFAFMQTLELWSLKDELQFRTTLTSRFLGITPEQALSNRSGVERATEQIMERLIAQFLAEAELGHFQVHGDALP